MPLKSPQWARDQMSEQDEKKAARLMVLYVYRNQLTSITKKEIAAALGVSRWTLDRDLASLHRVSEHAMALEKTIKNLISE